MKTPFYVMCVAFILLLIANMGYRDQAKRARVQMKFEKEMNVRYYMNGHLDGCLAAMEFMRKDSLEVYFRRAKEDSVKFVNSHQ